MLTFIGVSHIDPNGRRRLDRALETTGPEIILLEVSVLSVLLRRSLGKLYRYVFSRNHLRAGVTENPEIRIIKNYLSVPYEYDAVREYCRRRGARYMLIDSSLLTMLRYPGVWRLITRKNIETAAGITDDRFAREWAVAARVFGGSDPLLAKGATPAYRPLAAALRSDRIGAWRESVLVRRVRKALARHQGKRIVCVGGWEHCVDDPDKLVLYARVDGPKQRIIAFLKRCEL